MLESVTIDRVLQQQITSHVGRGKTPRKFQLPHLNLNLGQSIQCETPTLANLS